MTETRTRTDFARWLEQVGPVIEDALRAELAASSLAAAPPALRDAVEHALLGGGKRVRPALALLGCRAAGGEGAAATPAAVAVEMVHAYSLVHDDLPCMDDDLLRRGRPTVHAAFGEATAVLAGDALLTLAFECLTASRHGAPPERALAQAALLARAAGPAGMVGGQQRDMEWEGRGTQANLAAVEEVHDGKTGALLAASFLLGVQAAEADPTPWRPWAFAVGRLFQATDDLLDGSASTEQLGKTAGKDAAAGKATLVAALGLDGAREYARRGADEAGRLLDAVEVRACRMELASLPDYLLERCR